MNKLIQDLVNQFRRLLQSAQLSQAHLIECPLKKPVDDAIKAIVSAAICATHTSCGQCKSCQLVLSNTHPDLIQLSNTQQSIKVADIRGLAQYVYQAPKIAGFRLVVINSVDKLNHSAANALLKILEEPPKQVVFLLTCQTLSKVIATIRSRTVHWRLPFTLITDTDWLALDKWILHEEGKQQLLVDKSKIIEQIDSVYQQTGEPIDIAQSWQQYAINDVLWLLYLLHARALRQNYSDNSQSGYFADTALLVRQVYQIHAMMKLTSQGISLNNILMYETFLMACKGLAE